MNAELAVSFTLATYGSAWLARDPTVGSDPLHLARFMHGLAARVSFAGADSPQEWLEALAASGKDRIWLAIPDLQAPTRHAWHRRAAFAGGLPAGVLTTSRRGSTLWTASWNVSNTAGRRAWNVAYHGTDADFEPQRPPVEHAAAGLDAALAHAEEFATRLRLGPWTRSSGRPAATRHRDPALVPCFLTAPTTPRAGA